MVKYGALPVATIEHRTGDLLAVRDDVALAHGCNCAGAMGRGIAVEFRRRWPGMYDEYRDRCRAERFRPGDVFPWRAGGRWVYNLGTQADWRRRATLGAVSAAFSAMAAHAEAHGVRHVAMPRVAAGLGGLVWDDVEAALAAALDGRDLGVTVYTLP